MQTKLAFRAFFKYNETPPRGNSGRTVALDGWVAILNFFE